DQTLHLLPGILIIQAALRLFITLFWQSLRRNILPSEKLWVDLHLKLFSCPYLFQCIGGADNLKHLRRQPFMHIFQGFAIRRLVVIRNGTHPSFISPPLLYLRFRLIFLTHLSGILFFELLLSITRTAKTSVSLYLRRIFVSFRLPT